MHVAGGGLHVNGFDSFDITGIYFEFAVWDPIAKAELYLIFIPDEVHWSYK